MSHRIRFARSISPLLLLGLIVALVAIPLSVESTAAQRGGNSDNAKACQKGGWQSLQNNAGVPFTSQGECVASGAQGSGVVPIPAQTPVPAPVVQLVLGSASSPNDCQAGASLTNFAPSTNYLVEFRYQRLSVGTGDTFLRTVSVTTDASGSASIAPSGPAFNKNAGFEFRVVVGTVGSGWVPVTPDAC